MLIFFFFCVSLRFIFGDFSEILFLLRFVAFYLYLVTLGSNALWVRTHKGTIQSPKMEVNDTVATSEIGRDPGLFLAFFQQNPVSNRTRQNEIGKRLAQRSLSACLM